MKRSSKILLWALSGAAVLLTTPALAQTASATANPAPPAQNTTSDNTVGEVVVTAQRREEPLKDVPIAVTAVSAQQLIGKNEVSLDDYFRSVPGLSLNDNGSGFQAVVIRGVTTGTENTPTVGIYIDDTPVGSSTSTARGDTLAPDIDPSDLQRIEVLKGPQGTLYGASNMGGLLKYVTIAPDSRSYSGRIQVDGSAVDGGGLGYGVRGAVNVPIAQDQLALRLSAAHREDPGYIDSVNVTPNSNVNRGYVDNYRAALRWTPTSALTVDLTGLFQNRFLHGPSGEPYNFVTDQPIYGDLKSLVTPNAGTYSKNQQVYNLHVAYNTPWATLISSTSYARSHYDNNADVSFLFGPIFQGSPGTAGYNPDFGSTILQKFDTNKFTQEFRLNGTMDRFDWTLGTFYTFEESRYFQDVRAVSIATGLPINGAPAFGGNFVNSHYYEVAAFGDVTYHFTDRLSLQAGLRYSYNHQTNTSIGTPGVLTGPTLNVNSNASHEDVPTFVVAPTYKLTPDTTLYARIASGYRAGGPNYSFSDLATTNTYNSDSTIDYEAGIKSYLFGRKVYAEAAVFYIDWSDVQVLGTNPSNHEEFYVNGGGAVSQGVEANAQYHPLPGLTLGATFAYTDAHLTDDAVLIYGIDGRDGDRLPYSPRYAGSLSADYVHSLTDALKGSVGIEYAYQGDRASDFRTAGGALTTASPRPMRLVLDSYSVVNLHAGLNYGRYDLTVFLKNVADERGFLTGGARSLNSNNFANYSAVPILPRTFGVSLSAKF